MKGLAMPKERKDLTYLEEQMLTDEEIEIMADSAAADAFLDEDVSMPSIPLLTEYEMSEEGRKQAELADVKARLNMLYTARGNIIPRAGKRLVVTSKNFSELSQRIEAVRGQRGSMVAIKTQDWTIVISPKLSDLLRKHGQIDSLILAGWHLVAIRDDGI